MKILYIALKYDYGVPERGFSNEHNHFYNTLVSMEGGRHEIIYFPYDEIMREVGREKMNRNLLKRVEEEKPDLCFFYLFTDEIKKKTIKQITEAGETATLNWFPDDHWRFRNFSKFWAPLFDWIVTTDSEAPKKYNKIGCKNVIRSQWASNPEIFKKTGMGLKYDVSFVGQTHSDREAVVAELKNAGIKVECWGSGWPNGRAALDDMVRIFDESRINLNFSKSSGKLKIKTVAKIFLNRRADDSYHLISPFLWLANTLSLLVDKKRDQIKARPFEITGSGGLCMTGFADDMENYMVDGEEAVSFENTDELIEKIKYYLGHEEERLAIAEAGYRRTTDEHTYEKRFREIFDRVGFRQ